MSLDYLDRYADLRSPGYAVLVTGPWGSGKTHQVRRALIEPHQALYVTLYGEPDVEAIHQAVLAAAGPWKERAKRLLGGLTDVVVDTAKLAGPGAGAIASASGAALAPLIRRQLTEKINEGQLIVFDDLERSPVEPKALSGLINLYLEHHGCRVVVIANEGHLDPALIEAKEKLFGQTLRVVPEVDRAFESFFRADVERYGVAMLSSGIVREAIVEIFKRSEVSSLRIARQLIHDVRHLLDSLHERHVKREQALVQVIRWFSAWSCEVRAGRFERRHTDPSWVGVAAWRREENVPRSGVTADEEALANSIPEQEPFEKAAGRYFDLLRTRDIAEGPLRGEVLTAMLFDGRYDREAIAEMLDDHPLYASAKRLPAWRVLWHWWDFTAAELQDAAGRLERELETSADIENAGVVLHNIARALVYAREEAFRRDVDGAELLCRQYIDRCCAADPNDPPQTIRTLTRALELRSESSYDGLAFVSRDDPASDSFDKLRRYFFVAVEDKLRDMMPAYARRIVDLMPRDIEAFREAVLLDGPRTRTRTRLPFLGTIAVEDFVEQYCVLRSATQFEVSVILRQLRKFLSDATEETAWVNGVREALLVRAEAARDPFDRFRLRRLAAIFD